MTGRRVLPKRLLASIVLFCIGTLFFVLAAFFSAKGARWANEFSGVAGFFVALAALLSPLVGLSSARSMGPAFRRWHGPGPGPVERWL